MPRTKRLDRRAAVAALLMDRGDDLLVVAGLGASAWDCAAAGDHHQTFPLWGAMGGAVPMGLGLALARPDKRVLVINGDGEMLMGLGSLTAVGAKQPDNLAIVILDNERYGETGMQLTNTGCGTDLAAIAKASGIPVVATIGSEPCLGDAVSLARTARGPVFVVLKVDWENHELVLPPRDGPLLKNRFRAALGLHALPK
ncbi:MAG: thiamine pyrophosphate-dependent enzyme [Rhodospirillaceae bacterium]|nr:thiamine pyrophosphate-dependent enzyme [Rhodospirillaceae bacterium]